MSDEAPATSPAPAAAPNPVVASATQALAIKELGDTVAGVRRQIRALWIALAVLVVITVGMGALSMGPRLGLGGIGGTRPNWQRGEGPGTTGTTGGAANGSGAQDQVIEVQP